VAFARLLQEQERAFYERRVANAETPRREYGGDDDETDCAYDDDDNDETSDADLDANDPRSSLGGSPSEVFRVENATDTNYTVPGSGESDEDASLALARSLMEEEQREWRNRMFALAGVGDPDDEADEGVDVDGMTYEELTELGEHIGTQSKGVSKEAMATLTRFAYGDDCGTNNAEKQKDDDDDDENICAVCRLGFEFGDPCLGLPQCGHAYHAECLEPWLAENKSCPLCKTEIEGEAEAAA
jgi:E3 ubiquitin-protein ligase BIG BROTHER-like protein